MTKKQLLKILNPLPDDTIIMVEGENCPMPVGEHEEGLLSINGKVHQSIILLPEEDEDN